MSISRKRSSLTLSIGLALASLITVWFVTQSVADATDSPLSAPVPEASSSAPAAASLHNPTFDNHIWYWFHERHGYGTNLQPDAFIPDDDVTNGPQQWWLWFYNGTVPVFTWATGEVEGGANAVKGRTYWDGKHHAGLFQMIYDATPCLTYEFQMYGKAKLGQSSDVLHDFRVGIGRRGYRPTTWAVQSFPSTMEWGASHTEYVGRYGQLSVTAEALDPTISVFTYAEADGGVSAEMLWDTGSFRDATPEFIHDPNNLPPPNGVFSVNAGVGSTSANITWRTNYEALGQAYYRPVTTGGTALPYTNTIYLPTIHGANLSEWIATPLVKTPLTYHTANLTNLTPGQTYEYIAVSRGLLGDQCVTWVSDELTFTTNN